MTNKKKKPLRIEIVQKFYLCGQIQHEIIFLKETLSILNFHTPFILQIDQAKTKKFLQNVALHDLSINISFMVAILQIAR